MSPAASRSSRARSTAYLVSASSTWDLAFTCNGVPVANIPGAPAVIDGPSSTTTLRVDQLQSRVNDVD